MTKAPDLGQAHKSVADLNVFCEISAHPLCLYHWQNEYKQQLTHNHMK
jgi:hypothetical protein